MKEKYLHLLIVVGSLLAAFCSCSDDDSFSTSRSDLLHFSTDTLTLDTVFSGIPTPTRSFWVYNNSDANLRCASIRLKRGNQTGFRVNVDGTYLGASAGYQVSNVEVRKGDSLRVFVELTSPMNGAHEPLLLEDDLLFDLESGAEQRVALNAWSWDAEMVRNLHVSNETTLLSDRPIVVFGNIVVDSAATLRIPCGQTVYFHAGSGIDVYGRLLCEGTASENVTLRGDRIDRMFDYLPYDMVSGQWNGIRLHASSFENVISYTDIHSTFNGIVCDSSTVDRKKLEIHGSIVHNCQGDGIRAENCHVDMYNCQFTNTLGDCVNILGGNIVLQHCTLAQFYPFDSQTGVALRFVNAQDHPLILQCVNSLVTGAAEDVVIGEQNDSTTTFQYLFASSVLRTPVVDDTLRFKNIIWEAVEDTTQGGAKHFKQISMSTQHFDFHLDSLSSAVGKAAPQYALPDDRDGKSRDTSPDIGCYEF